MILSKVINIEAEHKIVINDKTFTIRVEVKEKSDDRKTVKLTYFDGNSEEGTYNWFGHLDKYIKFLNKHNEYDYNARYIQYKPELLEG